MRYLHTMRARPQSRYRVEGSTRTHWDVKEVSPHRQRQGEVPRVVFWCAPEDEALLKASKGRGRAAGRTDL